MKRCRALGRGSKSFSPRKRHLHRRHVRGFTPSRHTGIDGIFAVKIGMATAEGKDRLGNVISYPITLLERIPYTLNTIIGYGNTYYGLTNVWRRTMDKEMNFIESGDISLVSVFSGRFSLNHSAIHTTAEKSPNFVEIPLNYTLENISEIYPLMGVEIIDNPLIHGFCDVVGVTKGKGLEGPVRRHGIKLLSHRNSKVRRNVGTGGPKTPARVHANVPQSGQHGFHRRTEFNKQVLGYGPSIDIQFNNYSSIRRQPVIYLKGSIVGPVKGTVYLRNPLRNPNRRTVSLEGVVIQ